MARPKTELNTRERTAADRKDQVPLDFAAITWELETAARKRSAQMTG